MSLRRVVPSEAKQVRADLRALERELGSGNTVRLADQGREVVATR